MLSSEQIDIINFTNLFKGSRRRGYSALKTILNTPEYAEELIATPVALRVLLGNRDGQSSRICDIIRQSNYADRIGQAFIDSISDTIEGFIETVTPEVIDNLVSISTNFDSSIYNVFWTAEDFESRYFSVLKGTKYPDEARICMFTGFPTITQERFAELSFDLLDDISPIVYTRKDECTHLLGATRILPIDKIGSNGYDVRISQQNLLEIKLIGLGQDKDINDTSLGFTFTFVRPIYTDDYSTCYSYYNYDVNYPGGTNSPNYVVNQMMNEIFSNSSIYKYIKETKKSVLSVSGYYWYSNRKTTAYPLVYSNTCFKWFLPSFDEALGSGWTCSYFHSDEGGEQYAYYALDANNFLNAVRKAPDYYYLYPWNDSTSDSNQVYVGTSTSTSVLSFMFRGWCSNASTSTINASSSLYYLYYPTVSSEKKITNGTTSANSSAYNYIQSYPHFCI